MPADDLTLLTDAARAAGEIAMRHFRRDPAAWDKGGGAGPVTEADLAVDAMLRETLTAARPDYGWLSEETEDDPARLTRDRVFIVDPIDGTRAFIEGTTAFAHALAVAEAGRVVAGVVYLPAQGKLFAAAEGGGAMLNGRPIRASAEVRLPEVLMTSKMLEPSLWRGGLPALNRSFRPSLAYRLCLVAEGRFDAMVTFRDAWEWDIAAGCLIAAEAGAVVTDGQGGPVRFNAAGAKLPGCVAATPWLHATLMRHRGGA